MAKDPRGRDVPDRRLVLVPEAGEAEPASRFRIYDLAAPLSGLLPEFGIRLACPPAAPARGRSGYFREKYFLALNLLRVFLALATSRRRDVIYVQRGISELGLLDRAVFYLYLAFRRLGYRNMVFDLDDAVYLRSPVLVPRMMTLCRGVMAGSHALLAYASSRNPAAALLPTAVAVPAVPAGSALKTPGRVTLGWIGSPSNLPYLGVVREALRGFGASRAVALRIMCSRPPEEEFPGVKIEFVPWSAAGEDAFLRSIDIGIMPLTDTEWERGKCGFKLLRYMAYGLPAVGSAVGENVHIVEDGRTGFLASGPLEWAEKLGRLADSEDLRREIGGRAREFVAGNYSVPVVAGKLAARLRELFPAGAAAAGEGR